MQTVFLFVPHYVFSSDLLRTEYIGYLSQKYNVLVFSPIFKSSKSIQYPQIENVNYVYWTEEHPRFWNIFTKLLRVSLIREFDNLKYYKLRHLTKANLNWQRKLLRKASWFVPRIFLTTRFFTRLEDFCLPNSKKYSEYIKKYNPFLIITCTPGFSFVEAEAIAMAKKNNIKTVAVNSSWDNFTSNAIQFRKTDYLICWNQVMKNEAVKIHKYKENQVSISGIYRFDHHFKTCANELSREDFLTSKQLDPKLKTILLSTVPPNTYPPQYDVWRKIINMHKNNAFEEKVNILIRLHPNDSLDKYKEFQGIKNVHIELAGQLKEKTSSSGHKIEMGKSDLDNLRYSLKYTDININFRSSLSLEATIYDKPVINLALFGYANRYQVDWYIPILKSGGISLVQTIDELKNAVNGYLKNPNLNSSGRQAIFKEYVRFTDGLSYKRSINSLQKV